MNCQKNPKKQQKKKKQKTEVTLGCTYPALPEASVIIEPTNLSIARGHESRAKRDTAKYN